MKIAVIGKTTDNISLDKQLREGKPSSIIITNQTTEDMESYLWDWAEKYGVNVDYLIVDPRKLIDTVSDRLKRLKEAQKIFCKTLIEKADKIIVYADYSYTTKHPVLLLDELSKQIISLAEETNVPVEMIKNDLHFCYDFSINEADCKPKFFTIRINSREHSEAKAVGIATIKAKIKFMEFIDKWGSYDRYDFYLKMLCGNHWVDIDTNDIKRCYEHLLKLYTQNPQKFFNA